MEEMSKNQHETDGLMKKKSAGILPSFGLLQNQQLFLVGVLRLFTAKRDDRRKFREYRIVFITRLVLYKTGIRHNRLH